MQQQEQQFDLAKLPPPMRDQVLIQRELGERSLVDFVKMSWHVLEPSASYSHNWHVDAICEHLEAVSNDQILRLLINIPPRCMKSLLCSVMWPAWDWIGTPSRRWLAASYAQVLATRDSVKMRRLIQSAWYQQRWGDRFVLVGDQNAKERFENDKTGYRIATAVDALATGEGGDIQTIDDPHNVRQAESDAVRGGTITWLGETMATRFNDLKKPRRVLIMQRVHGEDCSGWAIEKGGYTHICLPMRFERSRFYDMNPDGSHNPDYVPPSPLGFEDSRTEEGELLWEDRFSDEAREDEEGNPIQTLTQLEIELGEYGTAGQHQQRPTPRGGGMVKREKLILEDEVPKDEDFKLVTVRSWDYAGTDPEKQVDLTNPDWTVGVLMGMVLGDADPDVWILDVVRFRKDPGERDEQVDVVANEDGVAITIWIEQEPGSSGKSVIFEARKRLVGYAVNPPRIDPMPQTTGQKKKQAKEAGVPTGNKVQRAEPFATHCHRGKVHILRREWTPAYIAEITTFPMSSKKDQMDATSQGFLRLMEKPPSTAELMAVKGYYNQGQR